MVLTGHGRASAERARTAYLMALGVALTLESMEAVSVGRGATSGLTSIADSNRLNSLVSEVPLPDVSICYSGRPALR
jgi:hypothetical protein